MQAHMMDCYEEEVASESRFSAIVKRLGDTVESKNKAYGDSFGKSADFMKILYPDGIKPEDYWKFLILTRMFDKMMRLATNNDPAGEDPFLDIGGYAILGMEINARKK